VTPSVSLLLILVVLLAPVFAPAARAGSSLAGTYVGTPACTALGASPADPSPVAQPSTLVVSVTASGRLAAEIDGVLYGGRLGEDGSDGVFSRCGVVDRGYGASEGQTLDFRFDGERIAIQGTYGRVGACKGTWTRVSSADPGLRACQ
jgi:hypothetical protein